MHRTLSTLFLALLLALAGAAHSAPEQGKRPAAAKTAKAKAAAKKPAKKQTKKAASRRAAASAAPAAAPTALRGADHIVAVVNSEPITDNEVRAATARVRHQMQQKRQSVPPEGELRRAVLERLISERAQQQYAKENGLEVSDQALA